MNAFRFIGKLEFNPLDSKIPYLRKGEKYQTLSFAVVPSKNNRAFVETAGFINEKIKTYNTEGTQVEIPWDDRLSEETISKVARYRRFSIKLDNKYHEFITEYDFVGFAAEHIEELKNKTFVVTGNIKVNIYNGKISFRYIAQSIREVAESENFEPGLTVRFDTFYRKADIDLDNWSKEKDIVVNAFTYQFIDKDTGRKYVPTTFHINLANETNDKKAALFLKQFGISLSNGDVKATLKDAEVVSLPVRCAYINGSEEIPFDESCLTDNQKELVELGLKSLEDFKPKGSIFGQRVVKFNAIDVDTRDKYADGYLVEQITAGEFDAEIFTIGGGSADPKPDQSDIEALFG